ncbi:hypothetical protein [Mucilaginibacter flavidus]|uniref:hypothetical protein n=1 Tax=Mucilaginibacter flavidus TaxID=2949309 RepID=UPI00209341D5|nr:hypothetical protein [Mucilaginibacter flavidus]MCO5946987.1 hypothetical protein [Mucilaginibacter flavidus]
MNLLRWILGIPLSLSITFGLIVLFVELNIANELTSRNFYFYLVYHLFLTISSFSLCVFLSCLFVPHIKKIAGLITVIIVFALAVCGFYIHIKEDYYQGVTLQFAINYVGIFTGLLIGFYISYEKFKKKGWHKLNEQNSYQQGQEDKPTF